MSNGINRKCYNCGKTFWCTDGDWFCSSKCHEEIEDLLYNENLRQLESDLDNLLYEYKNLGLSHSEYIKKWFQRLNDAEINDFLDQDDIQKIVTQLKIDYEFKDLAKELNLDKTIKPSKGELTT